MSDLVNADLKNIIPLIKIKFKYIFRFTLRFIFLLKFKFTRQIQLIKIINNALVHLKLFSLKGFKYSIPIR